MQGGRWLHLAPTASTEYTSIKTTTSGFSGNNAYAAPQRAKERSLDYRTRKAARRFHPEIRHERQFSDAHRRNAQGPATLNDTNGGINGTPLLLYLAADMVVDPATNRLFYVADGLRGNRRVLIVDANTGKYIGHFGAYGNTIPLTTTALAPEPLARGSIDAAKGNKKARLLPQPGALREDRR